MRASTLYRKKDKKNPNSYSYMLVLSTTKGGCSFLYIINSAVEMCYKNIDNIVFDGIGYIGFDRPLYVPWYKMHTDWEFVKEVPYRKLQAITTAIKQLMDGNIVQSSDGVFYYLDELPVENVEGTDTGLELLDAEPVKVDTDNITIEEEVATIMDNSISDEKILKFEMV